MTDHEVPSPLSLLKANGPSPLSEEDEAARRLRLVGRIDALRVELSASSHRGEVGLTPKPRSVVDLRWKWVLAAIVPLAAALLIVIQTNRPTPLVRVEGGELTAESAHGIRQLGPRGQWNEAEDVVMWTDASEATVTLPSDTHLKFSPRTRVQIHSGAGTGEPSKTTRGPNRAERIHLERGSVALNKALGSNAESFTVVTSHVLVLAHGTTFALLVEQLPSNPEQTRVVVQSGDVNVVSGGQTHQVKAGQAWTSPKLLEASTVAEEAVARAQTEQLDAGTKHAHRSTSSASNVSNTSNTPKLNDLAAQNRQFESAMAARRAAQPEVALQRLSTLIREFPGSEQAHNARVEQFRLLASLGRRPEARRSAQAYLRAYPRGFAANEASRIVANQ
jgi:hypothetical protein